MKRNHFYSFCIALLILFSGVFIICTATYAMISFAQDNQKTLILSLNIAFLLPILIVLFYNRYSKPPVINSETPFKFKTILFWILLLGATFLIRFWWILNVSPPPTSDFYVYYSLADSLAHGQVMHNEYVALFPHVIGLPAVLSVVFRIFGSSVFVVNLFNAVTSTLTVVFTYLIGKNLLDRRCGKIASVLMAFYPPSIFFCSLVSTENLHLLLVTFCIYLLTIAAKTKSFLRCCFLFLAFGIFVELSNAIRPVTTLFLVALIVTLIFFLKKNKPNIRKATVLTAVMLVAFIVTGQIVGFSIQKTVNMPISKGNMGYNLAVGMNIESKGTWNQEDGTLVNQLEKHSSAKEAHSQMQKLAFQRIRENPIGILNLMMVKLVTVWSDDTAGIWFSADSYQSKNMQYPDLLLQKAERFAAFYFLSLLVLVIAGLIKLYRNKAFHPIIVLVITVLGAIATFCILEAQSRYRFFLSVSLFIIASYAFYLPIRENLKDHIDHKDHIKTEEKGEKSDGKTQQI